MFVALMQTPDASSVASVGLLPRKSPTLACEVYDFRLRSVALLHRKSATVGLWADDPKKNYDFAPKNGMDFAGNWKNSRIFAAHLGRRCRTWGMNRQRP